MKTIKELARIQSELKAKKGQYNKFGKYSYRSCEDILEAVKPLLGDCALTLNDEIQEISGRFYIKSTAKLWLDNDVIEASAYAREALAQKGMADAQITGSTSSYARKYALNGLLCIDDSKDDDSKDNSISSKKSDIDIASIAKDCGWKIDQVLNSFSPALKSIDDIQDKAQCAEFLKNNKVK